VRVRYAAALTAAAPLGLVVCLAGYSAFNGLVVERFNDRDPIVMPYPHDQAADTTDAVVYFTGAITSGALHSAAIRPVLKQHGRAFVVEYPRHWQAGFDAATIIPAVYETLLTYRIERVTLVGSSLGGNLAADFIAYNREHGRRFQLQVILHDAPAGAESLYQGDLANKASLIYPGPLGNLASGLFWDRAFQEHPLPLGPGSDPVLLAVDETVSRNWPLTSYFDQLRYVVRYQLPFPGTYADVPAVIIRSERDDVVRPEAAMAWVGVFGSPLFLQIDTLHVDYNGDGDAARNAVQSALRQLGRQYGS
jgi:acetyl esterase/lipase